MAELRPLSYSGFRTYAECPLRWKFLYIDHLPETPRSYFSFGRSIHSALEGFIAPLTKAGRSRAHADPSQKTLLEFGENSEAPAPMGLEELLAFYKQVWVSEGYVTPEEERRYFDLGCDLLRRFRDEYVASPPRPLAVEQELDAKLDGIDVHGIVDRIDETPKGGLEVLDYKTSKELSWQDAKESDQLTLYQLLVEQNYHRPVETLTLYHMRTLSPLRTPARGSEEFGDLASRMGEVVDGIRAEAYEPRPGSYCSRCDFRRICPEWKEVPAGERRRVEALVERYVELQREEEGVRRQMEELAGEIHAVSDQLGLRRLTGPKGTVHRRQEVRWVFPPERMLPVIQGAGLLPRVARLDPELLERVLNDPRVPAQVRRAIREQASRRSEWALRLERYDSGRGSGK